MSYLQIIRLFVVLSVAFLCLPEFSFAQSGNCDPSTPFYVVNLDGDPDGTYITPQDVRKGNCCATSWPDRCIEFEITLDERAVGIAFDLYSGAVPSGSMYYQINCGPLIPVGEFVCLAGPGPHTLTFCKPGNNPNQYSIQSLKANYGVPADSVRVGCNIDVAVEGFIDSTVIWTDITSFNGSLDTLLTCDSACSKTTFNPVTGTPNQVKFRVCGMVMDTICNNQKYICDTVTLNVFPELQIPPLDTVYYCISNSGININAGAYGGLGNYDYFWYDSLGNVLSKAASYYATQTGLYVLEIRDDLYPDCPADIQEIRLLSDNPSKIWVGPDTVVCKLDSGYTFKVGGGFTSVEYATWSTSGNGIFTQVDTMVNNFYRPSQSDINGGQIILTLTTAQDTACPVSSDSKVITFSTPIELSLADLENVLCNGGNDGSIDLTIKAGSPPYNYNWSNGETTADISSLTAGNYSFTVEDRVGCTNLFDSTITQPDTISINFSIKNVSCNGGSDGVISTNVIGGTAPYSYSWSNGASSTAISGLVENTYSLTITDANGCTKIGSVDITQPLPIDVVANLRNISCFGGNDGNIQIVNTTGGTAPYTYNWSNGQTGAVNSNLLIGTYTLSVVDSNSCVYTFDYTLSEPTLLVIDNIDITNVSCYGGSDGSAEAFVSGGVEPYSYAWTSGSTASNATNLSVGAYQLEVFDSNLCTVTQAINITEPDSLVLSLDPEDVSCYGSNNGEISTQVTGGTSPYAFQWSDGSNQPTASSLFVGSYTVTLTDDNSCQVIQTALINQPDSLYLSITLTDVSCYNGNDGAIDVTAIGGVAPYNYNWSNGANTQNVDQLIAGNYTVTVTDSNNCSFIQSFDINQPDSMIVDASKVDVSCFGGSDGLISLTSTGGTAPYNYQWSSAGVNNDTLDNLVIGNYSYTVSDQNNCTVSNNITVAQPGALELDVVDLENVSCNGGSDGSIDVEVSFGTPPYAYNWSNGATTQDISSLSTNSYILTVIDNNGCTIVLDTIITEPDTLNIDFSVKNVSCNGGTNGTITPTISGGTAPYSYNWSDGSNSNVLSGVAQGNYSLTITDANGCTKNSSADVIQPSPINVVANLENISCNGGNNGSIEILNTSGGTGPYAYRWSSSLITGTRGINLVSGIYRLSVVDANLCEAVYSYNLNEPTALEIDTIELTHVSCYGGSNGSAESFVSGGVQPYSYNWSSGSTNSDATNLSAGTYQLEVIDSNLCSVIQSVNINQPDSLVLDLFTSDVSCYGLNDGEITSVVNGGTAPYSYSWSNGSSQSDISNLVLGTYTVTVTDANGCVIIGTATVNQPDSISIVGATSDISCFNGADGSISITPAGGTAPYTYNWSNGANTQNIAQLLAGDYTLTIEDTNSCVYTHDFTLTQPDSISVAVNSENVSCFGGNDGSIELSVSGGTPGYSYQWNNGSSSNNITLLASGIYVYAVTDQNNCTVSDSIVIEQPDALEINVVDLINVSCNGGSDGSIDVEVSFGTPPYAYNWSNGATAQDITSLSRNQYILTVTDDNGCTIVLDTMITEPDTLDIDFSVKNVSCYNGSDGIITPSISGGTAPYSYNWSDGSNASVLSGVIEGNYSLTITDANGCTKVSSTDVTQPLPIDVVANLRNISCFGGNDGNIQIVNTTGGTASYTYNWSNGQTGVNAINLVSGTYTLSVVDSNSCEYTFDYTLSEPTLLVIDTIELTHVSCYGGADGNATSFVSGGVQPYTYNWTSGSTNSDATNLSAGTYQLEVVDSNLCSVVQSVNITEPDSLVLNLLSKDVSCYGFNDGEISTVVNGGTQPYNYLWSNGSNQSATTGLVEGVYAVTVTDDKACQISSLIAISQPDSISIVGSTSDISCFEGEDGSISVIPSGGTMPYSYSWSNGVNTQNINQLLAGDYTLTIEDSNSCVYTHDFTLTQPDSISVVIAKEDVSCFGGNDGSIELTVSGGTPAYSYQWDNASSSNSIAQLAMGVYAYTVTDLNNCSVQNSVSITQPDVLSVNISGDRVVCDGQSTASIIAQSLGGTQPYTYLWNNGVTSVDNNNLGYGSYEVTVTDSNSCVAVDTHFVDQLNLQYNISDTVGCVGDVFAFAVYSAHDTAISSYTWNFNNDSILNTSSVVIAFDNDGSKSVQLITQTNMGCIDTMNAQIQINPLPNVELTPVPFICPGDSATLQVSGANSYVWGHTSSPANTSTVAPLDTTVYFVTGYNQFSCFTSDSVRLDVAPLPILDLGPDTNVCLGTTVTLNAGNWQSQEWIGNGLSCTTCSQVDIDVQDTSMYVLNVVSDYGCKTSDSITLNIMPIPGGIHNRVSESCENSTLELLAEPFNESYHWSPDSLFSNTNSFRQEIQLTESVEIFLESTNQYGCKSLDSMYVEFLPALERGYEVEGYKSCPGDSTLIDLPQNMLTVWLPQPGFFRQPNNQLLIFNDRNRDAVLVSTDMNGCVYHDTISLAVYDLPQTELPDTITVCSGVELTLPLEVNVPNASFLWSPDDSLDKPVLMQPTAVVEDDIVYTVQVTSEEGCSVEDSIFLNVVEPIGSNLNQDLNLCRGSRVSLQAPQNMNGIEEWTYTWFDKSRDSISGNRSISMVPDSNLSLMVIMENELCTPDTGYYRVHFQEAGTVEAGRSVRVYEGEEVSLAAETSGEGRVQWSLGSDTLCGNCYEVTFNAENSAYYQAEYTNEFGCKVTDSVLVSVYNTCKDEVFIPNTFTPNRDDVNDIFHARSMVPVEINYFRVFDRWGNLVFESKSMDNGWDGRVNSTPGKVGVYAYYLDLVCPSGSKEIIKGNVTLLR